MSGNEMPQIICNLLGGRDIEFELARRVPTPRRAAE